MLTYGSIGVFVATIAFFVYRAFGSMMFGPTATASHVLVKDRARAEALKAEIEADVAGGGAPLRAKFARVAEQHSTCPSAKKGGELGDVQAGTNGQGVRRRRLHRRDRRRPRAGGHAVRQSFNPGHRSRGGEEVIGARRGGEEVRDRLDDRV